MREGGSDVALGHEPQTEHGLFKWNRPIWHFNVSVAATSISLCGPGCRLVGNQIHFQRFKDREGMSCIQNPCMVFIIRLTIYIIISEKMGGS